MWAADGTVDGADDFQDFLEQLRALVDVHPERSEFAFHGSTMFGISRNVVVGRMRETVFAIRENVVTMRATESTESAHQPTTTVTHGR